MVTFYAAKRTKTAQNMDNASVLDTKHGRSSVRLFFGHFQKPKPPQTQNSRDIRNNLKDKIPPKNRSNKKNRN